jgi:hypothetical protein
MLRPLVGFALVFPVAFALLIALFRLPPHDPAPALTACAVPCWQGMEISTTTRDQALAVMNRLMGSSPTFAVCYDRAAGSCELYRWDTSDESAAVVEIGRGKLTMLTFNQPDLTLGDTLLALHRLDEPLDVFTLVSEYGDVHLQLSYSGVLLTLELDVACPSTYHMLLQAPVQFLGINAPTLETEAHDATPLSVMRKTFYRNCEIL